MRNRCICAASNFCFCQYQIAVPSGIASNTKLNPRIITATPATWKLSSFGIAPPGKKLPAKASEPKQKPAMPGRQHKIVLAIIVRMLTVFFSIFDINCLTVTQEIRQCSFPVKPVQMRFELEFLIQILHAHLLNLVVFDRSSSNTTRRSASPEAGYPIHAPDVEQSYSSTWQHLYRLGCVLGFDR